MKGSVLKLFLRACCLCHSQLCDSFSMINLFVICMHEISLVIEAFQSLLPVSMLILLVFCLIF